MKSILIGLFTLIFIHQTFAFSSETRAILKDIDLKRTNMHYTAFLMDQSAEEFLQAVLEQVWGDERLSGYCFGLKASDFSSLSRQAQSNLEFDLYPQSWRAMSAKFSDLIYKEAKKYLNYDYQAAGKASHRFIGEVKGRYFKGCKVSWEGSFGGGNASLYLSEDSSLSIGRIHSWSE